MKKTTKKTLSILLVFLILFTNYAFAAGATISYTNQRTGGSKVSTIAREITDDYYLDGTYNAKSIEVNYDKIEICNCGKPEEKQELQGPMVADSKDIPEDYEPGKYFLFADKTSATGGSIGSIKYGIRLPAGEVHITDVVTFIYVGGIKYDGKIYDVRLDVKEINKVDTLENNGTPIIFASRLGRKAVYDQSTDPTSYDMPTYPTLSAEIAHDGSNKREFQMEAKIEYYIIDHDTKQPIQFSGVWGVEDIDSNEGLVVNNFIPSTGDGNDNMFILRKTLNDPASTENFMYKRVDSSATYIFSNSSDSTDFSHVYLLMNDRSKITGTKTWDKGTVGAAFTMKDGVIQRYNNVYAIVKGRRNS